MLVDAHQHYWNLKRADYGWLTPALAPLYRNFLPADLAPLRSIARVDKTVLVQAAPTSGETEYLLALARQESSVAAVVGWVNLLAPDASQQLGILAADSKFKGVRPMLQDLEPDDWIASPAHLNALDAAAQAMIRHDLVFDALVKTRHLPHLLAFAERHPGLRIVIDHGAKPPLRGMTAEWNAWMSGIAALARLPNVNCKLSGLATEAAPGWDCDTLLPAVAQLLTQFGPARLLWGSDWPVLNLNGDYLRWMSASRALLDGCSDDERAAVFGGNANDCYRLGLS